jgi:hypothetical protein
VLNASTYQKRRKDDEFDFLAMFFEDLTTFSIILGTFLHNK